MGTVQSTLMAAATLALFTVDLNAAGDRDAKVNLEKLPLVFNPNVGQVNPLVRFTSQGLGYSLYFTDHGAILELAPGKDKTPKVGVLRLSLSGSRESARAAGMDALAGKTNYLIGNDPAKWLRGIPGYGKIVYRGVLPGIDLIYYGQGRHLEYDFRISPGADPRKIQVRIDGEDWTARATPAGELEIRGAGGSVRFARPVAYQVAADGSHEPVEADYAIQAGRRFGFRLGRYDRQRELIIDPTLSYATYYGGSGQDYANGVAVDPSGNIYIAGATGSTDLPTVSALEPTNPAPNLGVYSTNSTGFVAKFDPTLSHLIYATYLGGSTSGSISGPEGNGSAVDQVNAIAVDNAGNAYLTGGTTSTDFPLKNAVQSTCGPQNSIDRFYCTVTPTSTCASPSSLPDAFVTKLDPTGANLVYSTYLGGSLNDVGSGIAVNPTTGDAFVAGGTLSITGSVGGVCPLTPYGSFGFPTTGNAYMTTPVNPTQPALVYAFLARMSSTGSLVYSTYFGPQSSSGKSTGASGVAIDASNNVYFTGSTNDLAFPVTPGAAQTQCLNCPTTQHGGASSAWIAKFNTATSGAAGLLYSTFLGGSDTGGNTFGSGIAVDSLGNAYVTGSTEQSDFPTTPGSLQSTRPGGASPMAWVAKLNPSGTQFSYSTYLGGSSGFSTGSAIAVDGSGGAVVTGIAQNPFSFPLVNPFYTVVSDSPYVLRLTPNGSGTTFGTYFGAYTFGAAGSYAIALDTTGNAYIAGTSNNIPSTTGSYSPCPNKNNCATTGNGNLDAFVAKINPAGPPTAFMGQPYSSQLTLTGGTWSVTSGALPPGLTLSSGGHLSGTPLTPGAYAFTAQILNGASATVSATYSLTVQSQAGCTYSLFYPGTSGPASAFAGNVGVTASAPNCAWAGVSNASWLTITANQASSGNGSLAFTAAANTGAAARTGTLTIAGQTFTVTQAGTSSSLSAAPAGLSFTYQIGGAAPPSATLMIGSSGAALNFTLQGNAAWLVVPGSGSTSAPVSISVNPAGLLAGTYSATVTVTAPGASNSPLAVPVTFTVYGSLQFYPIAPCRVADTRSFTGPPGPLGPPSMSAHSIRSFPVLASACGIPFSAVAYSLNISAVPTNGYLGYLTVWATDGPQPVASTLNSWDGRIVANAAIVPAGTAGAISIYVSDTTDVFFDINGYFAPPGVGVLQFYPLPPCRVADTRSFTGPPGPLGPPSMAAGTTRSFPVLSSACGIPATAVAYALNMSAVPGTKYLGYLTTWGTGQPQPVASTLNSWTGTIVANAAIVPAGTGGAISIFVSDATDVFFDINGYFAPPGAGGLHYHPLAPCRVADTRSFTGPPGPLGPPSMAAGTSRSFPVLSSACGIPATAVAYAFNMTAVPSGNYLGYLTTWGSGQPQPIASTLNSWTGTIVPNAAVVPAGTGGAISLYVSDASDVFFDINGYFAP